MTEYTTASLDCEHWAELATVIQTLSPEKQNEILRVAQKLVEEVEEKCWKELQRTVADTLLYSHSIQN